MMPERHAHFDKAQASSRRATVPKIRLSPISYAALLRNAPADEEDTFLKLAGEFFDGELQIVPIGRARAGIYLLVKYALRTGRKKVLLSPFTIPDVANMVTLAGGEPVFFDSEVNSTRCDLDNLFSLIADDIACVMLTHYHVNETRIDQIAKACEAAGALFFDDCAIALGGTINGARLGGLANASVFSFSAFKLLNFFWGGMITTRDPAIAAFLRKATAQWPELSLSAYARQAQNCLKYDMATRPTIFDKIVFPSLRRKARVSNRAHSLEWQRIENTTLDATLTSRPHRAAFAEWNRKFGQVSSWLEQRRRIARIYQKRLGDIAVSGPLGEADFVGGGFSCYPVVVDPQTRDAICHRMMLSGFDMGLHLYPNVHTHPRYRKALGRSDNVSRLVASSVYLPTHFGVSEAYADAMAAELASQVGLG